MTFSAVKKILNKKVLVAINREKGSVPLKEDDPQSKNRKVEIWGLHKDTIVFKLDYKKFKKKSAYLSDNKGLHSGCDYVIVTRNKGKRFILFLELKSNSKGAAAQLRNSIPFIDYMTSLLKIHHGFDFDIGFDRRYIVFFAGKGLNKKRIYSGHKSKDCFIEKDEGLTINCFKNTEKIYISKIL
jgi:hypothetical protein